MRNHPQRLGDRLRALRPVIAAAIAPVEPLEQDSDQD